MLNRKGKKLINTIKEKTKILFEKGAFHVFAGNFIMKFIGLFGSIFIVRLLSKSDYGTLSYVENLYSYGYVFSGLGLSMAATRYGVLLKTNKQKKGVYLYLVKKQWIVNSCLMGILISFAWFYPHPSRYIGAAFLLTVLVIGLPFQDMQNTSLLYERSQLANRRYMYLSIFAAGLSVLLRVFGSWLHGVQGTIIFKVLAEILGCVVIFVIMYRQYFLGIRQEKVEKGLRKEIWVFSINNMVANGIWILFMLTDTFLIGRLLNNPGMLADYKVAYVMPSNLSIITSAIAIFVTPYFIKNEEDFKWVRKNYYKVMGCNFALVGTLSMIMFVFAPQIICLLYGKEYLNVVTLMRLLLIAHLVNSGIKTITSSLLAAMGYAKQNMQISLVAFILQIISASYVIPRYGIMGLAVNNIVVYIVMSIMFVCSFMRKFRV